MKNEHDVIRNMLRTEKGSNLLVDNKYVFKVDRTANKIDVKRAIESIYKVKVDKVHVMNVKGKLRRLRYREGRTASWRKAIVTLAAGNKIEVT